MSNKYYTVNGILYSGDTTIDELVKMFGYHPMEIRDREIKTKQDFCTVFGSDSKDQHVNAYDLLTVIESLVATGNKITAIKVVRSATEWSLRDAKDFVEQRIMK